MPHTDPEILAVRPAFLAKIGKEYATFARSQENVRATLQKRDVKYILWDKRETPELDPSVLGPLTLLATSTDLALYSLSLTQ